jgi:hypothetical protein
LTSPKSQRIEIKGTIINGGGFPKIKPINLNKDKVELAASEILTHCNVIVDKNLLKNKMLKKGEGKTIGGSGETNFEVYNSLLKTYY